METGVFPKSKAKAKFLLSIQIYKKFGKHTSQIATKKTFPVQIAFALYPVP